MLDAAKPASSRHPQDDLKARRSSAELAQPTREAL
jgi:hypothetical protein